MFSHNYPARVLPSLTPVITMVELMVKRLRQGDGCQNAVIIPNPYLARVDSLRSLILYWPPLFRNRLFAAEGKWQDCVFNTILRQDMPSVTPQWFCSLYLEARSVWNSHCQIISDRFQLQTRVRCVSCSSNIYVTRLFYEQFKTHSHACTNIPMFYRLY